MIQFKKQDNVIPIDFGEFELSFVANDENLSKMMQLGEDLRKGADDSLKNIDDSESINAVKSIVSKAWNDLFGLGTFEKVYDFSGGSVIRSMSYLLQTIDGINEEYAKQTDSGIIDKYLNKVGDSNVRHFETASKQD